ncbi:uncharacterized protein [Antedon mediterranea]|uniref:uncharacterized protein n=1 Tax=Antedon mediterranea TaxID=105859 RepID=UPI003AF4DAC0
MFTDTCSRVVVRPLVVLLLVVCSVEGDYTPQCHKDCSWENWKGDVQICSQNNTMGRINDKKSLCPNFFQSSLERDEPVEPIQNVSISHYSATYTYPDGRVYEHTVTGLNISFDVDPAGLGLYTGAIIEIIGVKHQAFHFDKLGCFYLNFHGTLNNSTLMLSMNKTKRMFFDCARSLAPDSTYQITIKMAPFTSKPAISRYTIPSCFYSPNDFFCKVPEEEMARVWTPETFEVDVSRDKEVVLVFNLAPFAFNHYKVWLQEARLEYGKQVNLGKQEPCVDIYVENNTVTDFSYCSQPHNFTITWKTSNTKLVTVTFTGVKPATYIVELLPWPLGDNSQKCLKNDISFQCTVMSSKPSEVKVHPKEEDYYNVPTIPTLQESQGFKHDEQGNVVAIAIASLCSVLVAALVSLIIYKSKKRNDQDIYHIDEEDNEGNKSK